MKERETKTNLNKAEKISDEENKKKDQSNNNVNEDSEEGDRDQAKLLKSKFTEFKNVENSNQNIDDAAVSNLSSSSSQFCKKKRK